MTFVSTPPPPYYAVIFTFRMRKVDLSEYLTTSERLMSLARQMPGFYGEEAARVEGGTCISVSYWRSESDIQRFRDDVEHERARRKGKKEWYESFLLRVARVERAYSFQRSQVPSTPEDRARPEDHPNS